MSILTWPLTGDALVEGTGPDALRGLKNTLWLFRAARFLGKRIALFGISVRYRSEPGRELVREICDIVDVVTVREPGSYQAIRESGAAASTLLMPDLSYMLAAELSDCAPGEQQEKILGIAPLALHNDHNTTARVLARTIRDILDSWPHMSVTLFGFHAYDQGLSEDIIDALRSRGHYRRRIRIERYSPNPISMLRSIARCDYIMTVRLHPAIFATMAQRPLLALEGRPTVGHVLRYVGYPAKSVIPYDFIHDRKRIMSEIEHMFRCPGEYVGAINPLSLRAQVLSAMHTALTRVGIGCQAGPEVD